MNDYIRSPGYGITTGSANTYTLILTPSLTSYTAGVCVAIKIHAANTGASTININGLGAKSIKDSKGNNLTSGKLVLNSIYTLRYDGKNFILQGEGGEYGTASASDVLVEKTIGTDNGIVTGTIASKGAEIFAPSTSNRTIASGQYLSGVQTISPVTGTTVVGDVLSGKTFSSASGINLTGIIPSKSAATITPGTTNQTLAAGQYLSGIQTISGSANLAEENIKNGVNIFGKVGNFNPFKIYENTFTLTYDQYNVLPSTSNDIGYEAGRLFSIIVPFVPNHVEFYCNSGSQYGAYGLYDGVYLNKQIGVNGNGYSLQNLLNGGGSMESVLNLNLLSRIGRVNSLGTTTTIGVLAKNLGDLTIVFKAFRVN